MMIRRYSEMIQLKTFHERFEYLKLEGGIGIPTFGFDRYLNQMFYGSREWHDVRNYVMLRDNGCNLAVPEFEIMTNPLIHHMNPINSNDIVHNNPDILDPEYLVLTMHDTHNAIHFGTGRIYPRVVTERSPGDTRLW